MVWIYWKFIRGAVGIRGAVILVMLLCVSRITALIPSSSAAVGRFMKTNLSSTATAGLHDNPAPGVMHATLDVEGRSRCIIVGDVHGCLDELKLLLDQCRFNNQEDALVFVGDLVNKGPSSAGVIKLVRELRASCVRGNHDDAAVAEALDAKLTGSDLPSKYQYMKELNEKEIDWLIELPYTISIPSFNALIVHAGFVPGVSLADQKPSDMYTIRTVPVKNSKDKEKEMPWAGVWREKGPHVFFGHDAKRGLQLCEGATGLDTGCCYGRKLTAIILPEREIVQVQALRAYEEPKIPKAEKI